MVHIRVLHCVVDYSVYILLSLAASGPHSLCILTVVQMSAFCKFVCGFFSHVKIAIMSRLSFHKNQSHTT